MAFLVVWVAVALSGVAASWHTAMGRHKPLMARPAQNTKTQRFGVLHAALYDVLTDVALLALVLWAIVDSAVEGMSLFLDWSDDSPLAAWVLVFLGFTYVMPGLLVKIARFGVNQAKPELERLVLALGLLLQGKSKNLDDDALLQYSYGRLMNSGSEGP